MTIRNNINGDYYIIENLDDIRIGGFANINWRKKSLMLPYSPRNYYISFSDKKWDFRFEFNKDGSINFKSPYIYEILQAGNFIEHKCEESNS